MFTRSLICLVIDLYLQIFQNCGSTWLWVIWPTKYFVKWTSITINKTFVNQGRRVNWPIPTSSYDSNMEPQFSHKIRRFQYCTIYHLILVNFGLNQTHFLFSSTLTPKPKPGLRNRTCPACQTEDQKTSDVQSRPEPQTKRWLSRGPFRFSSFGVSYRGYLKLQGVETSSGKNHQFSPFLIIYQQ